MKPLFAPLKRAAQSGAVYSARFAIGAHRFIRGFEPWGIVLVMIGLLLTLTAMIFELEDRQSERMFRAWQTVLQVEERNLRSKTKTGPEFGGQGALANALEYLNRDFDGFVCDRGSTNPGPWISMRWYSARLTGNPDRSCLVPKRRRESLARLNLRRIVLTNIRLPGALLLAADLSRAKLRGANLSGAYLTGADLSGANLRKATLSDAYLLNANLSGAYLLDANLSGADLRDATGLQQKQLDMACGKSQLKNVPPPLIWNQRPCPKKRR